MKFNLKKIIKKILPGKVLNFLVSLKNSLDFENCYFSYSQDGEDMILKSLLNYQDKGFYIDIGAHHPKRFSNTYFFYKLGWRGINIDAMPNSMKIFNKIRPKDINVEVAISDKNEELIYCSFNEPALNGFLEYENIEKIIKEGYKLLSQEKIRTNTLKDVLENLIVNGIIIDFMNIDVEGFELNVLKSNDWKRFKPKFLIVEILNCNLDVLKNNAVYKFILDNGYFLVANTLKTFIFRKVNN